MCQIPDHSVLRFPLSNDVFPDSSDDYLSVDTKVHACIYADRGGLWTDENSGVENCLARGFLHGYHGDAVGGVHCHVYFLCVHF